MLKLINVTTMIGEHQVIHDVSLQIAKGDFVALLGGNGAGKTTCFYMIVGLVAADGGEVFIDDTKLRWPLSTSAAMMLVLRPPVRPNAEASLVAKYSVRPS